MILIAHRGNTNGSNIKNENKPEYLLEAIKAGYDIELDLWVYGSKILLGHDKGMYRIDEKFVYKIGNKAWFHCKNLEAIDLLKTKYNYFWHEKDKYTITNQGYIWAYPSSVVVPGAINVMPEMYGLNKKQLIKGNAFGVCSDFIGKYI